MYILEAESNFPRYTPRSQGRYHMSYGADLKGFLFRVWHAGRVQIAVCFGIY